MTQDSNLNFNLKNLYTIKSESTKSSVQFAVYGGNTQISIFTGEFGSGTKPVNITINPILRGMMINSLKEVMKGAPGSRIPLLLKKWDQDARTYKVVNIICFGKDDNNVIYLEIKNDSFAPEKYPIRGIKSIERSGEVDNEGIRSKYEADALLNFMQLSWDTASMLSRFNMPVRTFSKNGSGYKPNSDNNYKPTSAPTAVKDDSTTEYY